MRTYRFRRYDAGSIAVPVNHFVRAVGSRQRRRAGRRAVRLLNMNDRAPHFRVGEVRLPAARCVPPWHDRRAITTSSPASTRGIQAARSPIFAAIARLVALMHRAWTTSSPVRSTVQFIRLIGGQRPPDD
jgi:hypothetical protein